MSLSALPHPHSATAPANRERIPIAPPHIRQNFLSAGRDRQTLRDGVRMVRAIAAQPTMRPFIARDVPLLVSTDSHRADTIGRYDHCLTVLRELSADA